jgi:quinol monooxygenase YgiN
MIYVEVNFSVTPGDRAAAIDCLNFEAPAMRALPGNRACRVLTDPNDSGAVTLLHRWDDLTSFDAYRTGPLLAQIGGVLRPMMTGAPSTVVYEATALG